MRVVCDIDGVLAEYNEPFRQLLIGAGATMRPFGVAAQPTTWDWYEVYGATPEQVKAASEHTSTHPEWWGCLPPHPEFDNMANNRLAQACFTHEVTFVTTRPCGRDQTVGWLKYHLSLNPQVVLCPRQKLDALFSMEPDVIIEDRLKTLQQYRDLVDDKSAPPCRLLLVNRRYNQGDRQGMEVFETTGDALKAL